MAREKITDNTYVKVIKNMVGGFSYDYRNINKLWRDSEEHKKLEVRELNEIMATNGGRKMFENDELLIVESNFREHFGLEPLSEYVLTYEKIKEIYTTNDIELLEEKIKYCTDNEMEIFLDVAKDIKLDNRNAIKILEDYNGVDLQYLVELSKIEPKKTTEVKETTKTRKPRELKKK